MARVPEFRYAPEDRRSADEKKAQRTVVREQIEKWVAELKDESRSRASTAHALTVLRDRRGGAPFELDEYEYPVTPHRLLVRKDHVAEVLREIGPDYAPQTVPIPELDDVCVLQDIGAGPRRLRRSGVVARAVADGRARPSYVALLGAIRKAEGGPEPSGPPGGAMWEAERAEVGDDGPLIVIIDNGVSAEERADGWLAGLARSDNLDLLNVVPFDGYLDLGAGHGTFTAGIVQQVAPGVRLDVRRALDTEGLGDEVDIGREIVRAAADGAEIINLSLGFVTPDNERPLALEAAIRTAVRIAEEQHGIHLLLVCAAGNYGDERPCWPAAFCEVDDLARHVVSVAALRLNYDDPTDVVGAEWSTHGQHITCSTLGQAVVSTYVVGMESPESDQVDPDTFAPNSWATWSGTSFAAPQVAGAIVRIMREDRVATAREACDRLLAMGEDAIPGYGTSIRILPV